MVWEDATLDHIFNFKKFISVHDMSIHIVTYHNTEKVSRTDGKGQLISKCPYEKSVLSKIPTKKFPRFLF